MRYVLNTLSRSATSDTEIASCHLSSIEYLSNHYLIKSKN